MSNIFRRVVDTALAASLFFAAAGASHAQSTAADTTVVEDSYQDTYFAVGLNAGLLSGAGLGARVSFPGRFGLQGAFFVITLGDYIHFNAGGEAQYALDRTSDGRLYALLGLGFYSSTSDDETKPGNRIANPFRTGLGVGYEWFTSQSLVVSLSGALTYFPSTGEVYPLPELGMYYYFR